MKVYVVKALRWGDRENHSYVVGVYSSELEAQKAGKEHRDHRGGKYECEIQEFEVVG